MTRYKPDLTTLGRIKASRGIDSSADDALLTEFIHQASDLFQSRTNRTFVPYVDAEVYDARGSHVEGRMMLLDGDWLEVSQITNGDGSVLESTDFFLLDGNRTPKYAVELSLASGQGWNYTTDWRQAISVRGTLGYVENYGSSFGTVSTLSGNGTLTSSDTTAVVATTSGYDVLDYVRMDKELAQITAIYTGTPGTLTITRGVQGTTAQDHLDGVSVEVFRPEPRVRRAVNRIVSFMYERRDTAGSMRVQFGDGTSVFEDEMPREAERAMMDYHKGRF